LRHHAGLAGELALAGDVQLAGLVVADEHRGEAHRGRAGGLDGGRSEAMISPRRRMPSMRTAPPGVRSKFADGASTGSLTRAHWISPLSSKSMMLAAGAEPRPGIVVMSPQIG
jgi:hypothetical protein